MATLPKAANGSAVTVFAYGWDRLSANNKNL